MAKQTKAASKSASSKTTTSRNGSGNSKSGSAAKQQQPQPEPQTESAGMSMSSMVEKVFLDQIKDIYYVEKTLVKSLSKMAKKATTEELKQAFLEHQEVTQEQMGRLEQIFEILGKRPQAKRCPVMDGLQQEADELMEETEDDTLTRDVALIITAQKIEHYEIATYGCLATLARTYGMQEVADLLQQTLEEEKETDQNLTDIAENSVNYGAGQEQGGEAEEEDEE